MDCDLSNLEFSYSDKEIFEKKLARLKELYKWTETYYSGEKFQYLRDSLLNEILAFSVLNNIYDFDYFILFLKSPLEDANDHSEQQKKKI